MLAHLRYSLQNSFRLRHVTQPVILLKLHCVACQSIMPLRWCGCLPQALSMLVEHSGCDMRTAINTLQLLARQHAPQHHASTQAPSSGTQQGGSQRRGQRVRITAADIQSKGAFGVKDVAHTPLNVVQDMLASSSSRSMAARLQQLAAAMKAEQQGAAAGSSRGGRRTSRGAMPAATLSAAAAARLALQEHYSMLLNLGEHEQVGRTGSSQSHLFKGTLPPPWASYHQSKLLGRMHECACAVSTSDNTSRSRL